MSLVPINWYYPLCAVLMWVLALVLIPKKNENSILVWISLGFFSRLCIWLNKYTVNPKINPLNHRFFLLWVR